MLALIAALALVPLAATALPACSDDSAAPAATPADAVAPDGDAVDAGDGGSNVVNVQVLAINDFHGNLEAPTGTSGMPDARPDDEVPSPSRSSARPMGYRASRDRRGAVPRRYRAVEEKRLDSVAIVATRITALRISLVACAAWFVACAAPPSTARSVRSCRELPAFLSSASPDAVVIELRFENHMSATFQASAIWIAIDGHGDERFFFLKGLGLFGG